MEESKKVDTPYTHLLFPNANQFTFSFIGTVVALFFFLWVIIYFLVIRESSVTAAWLFLADVYVFFQVVGIILERQADQSAWKIVKYPGSFEDSTKKRGENGEIKSGRGKRDGVVQ